MLCVVIFSQIVGGVRRFCEGDRGTASASWPHGPELLNTAAGVVLGELFVTLAGNGATDFVV